jgi:hypothetical protein
MSEFHNKINEKKAMPKFCNTACYATEAYYYSDHSETGEVHVIIIMRQ